MDAQPEPYLRGKAGTQTRIALRSRHSRSAEFPYFPEIRNIFRSVWDLRRCGWWREKESVYRRVETRASGEWNAWCDPARSQVQQCHPVHSLLATRRYSLQRTE